ncbi:MAG: phospholipase D family protein [Gammaproteobacteria bacterium]|nr:phospholipase D family protein [Gammaproteobacteria bacterium]
MRILRRFCLIGIALSLGACASLQPRPDTPHESALPAGQATMLDKAIAPAEEKHAGESGFRLVSQGPEAFAIRARTAIVAGRSLDVQTYIWNNDGTGMALAYLLLQAADRGVKVRLLVDDMDARSKNYGFAALDAHPNMEVRMFNPFQSRYGTLGYLFEAAGSFDRINHRMHNKTWIADNRVAIVGGRNLGDEYFGASEDVNFVDLDFAMVGPIVRDASASFDKYWNSPMAYPMSVLAPKDVNTAALEDLRKKIDAYVPTESQKRFTEDLKQIDEIRRMIGGDWPMEWSARYQFMSDDPLKAIGQGGGVAGSQVLTLLSPMVKSSRKNLTVISPYFVPGKQGTEVFVDAAKAGSDVGVLTNSLAANDVAMVYGGYSEWREPLLKGGVKLWELKPQPGSKTKSSFFGSSGASLHTKALTVDGRYIFVGSFNLDPRTPSLNCEQGVFVDNVALSHQLEQLFNLQSSGTRAWEVTLVDGELRWSDGKKTWDSSPEASAGRKFQAWLAKVLPVSSQL